MLSLSFRYRTSYSGGHGSYYLNKALKVFIFLCTYNQYHGHTQDASIYPASVPLWLQVHPRHRSACKMSTSLSMSQSQTLTAPPVPQPTPMVNARPNSGDVTPLPTDATRQLPVIYLTIEKRNSSPRVYNIPIDAIDTWGVGCTYSGARWEKRSRS